MVHNILLADNDEDFLIITSEFLQSCGFKVIKANNPFAAHQILLKEHEQLRLAVIDSRLMNDLDERDTSGIDLARLFTIVPSIILTRFPSVNGAVEALRPFNGNSPVRDYVDKRDGLDVLLQAIQNILSFPSTVEIHEKLVICFNNSELRHLCFTLQIDYENLPGNNRQDKALELILHFERRGRLTDLITACCQARPLQFC